MKYARLIIGIVIVLVALWIIVREQMSGASSNAVVNAPVVTVRAPVAGDVQISDRQLGSRVSEGVVLASIEDSLADRVRLNDLLMEERLEEETRKRIETVLEETREIRQSLQERGAIFRTHRLEELRARLRHAEDRLAILEERGDAETADQDLLDAVEDGADRLPAEPRLPALVLDHARERVEVLEIALQAAEQGMFLGDGYNDSPNAEQRVVELDSEIAALTAAVEEATARHDILRERIGREQFRVNALVGGNIQSPVDGIFWEILEADGTNVQRGDPLVRLVDCSATMVTLSVTERVYNRLSLGQSATFRLGGSSEIYQATIGRLAGSGAETVYRNLAVAPTPLHLQRFDVALLVPDLQRNTEDSCMIGRTGRAFFDNRPLDRLRDLFR